jgi:hypothetical protein
LAKLLLVLPRPGIIHGRSCGPGVLLSTCDSSEEGWKSRQTGGPYSNARKMTTCRPCSIGGRWGSRNICSCGMLQRWVGRLGWRDCRWMATTEQLREWGWPRSAAPTGDFSNAGNWRNDTHDPSLSPFLNRRRWSLRRPSSFRVGVGCDVLPLFLWSVASKKPPTNGLGWLSFVLRGSE